MQLVALLEPIAPCSFLLPVPGLECQKNSGLDLGRLDFKAATMLVSECAVNGRIGRCKTEDSMYEVPLDADLAQFSLDWKCGVSVGLVFPSARTGGCQHAGQIQQNHICPAGLKIGLEGVGWRTCRHSDRCAAALDAPRAGVHDYGYVWQCWDEVKAGSEFKSCEDDLAARRNESPVSEYA